MDDSLATPPAGKPTAKPRPAEAATSAARPAPASEIPSPTGVQPKRNRVPRRSRLDAGTRPRRWRRIAIDILVATGFLIALGGFNLYYYLNHYLDPAFVPPPKSERGFKSNVYVDRVGKEYKYAIFIPHVYDKEKHVWGLVERYKKPPVIMFLNGVGENGDDGIMQIKKWFGPDVWEMKRRFPFLVIAPQCQTGPQAWRRGMKNSRRALNISRAVLNNLRLSEQRICLTGLSSGGAGTLELARDSPDDIIALVPICTSYYLPYDKYSDSSSSFTHIQLWSFHNSFDAAPIPEVHRYIRADFDKTDDRHTAYLAGGHDSWSAAYRSAELYEWILTTQSRVQ